MYRADAGDGPEPIGFLLVPKFSMMAFLCAVEPLRVANRLAGREIFAWHAYSSDGAPVEASNGMRIMVEGPVEAIARVPTLLVCAGFEPERFATRNVLRALQRLARAGVVLGGIDTGALLLARARLLDGVTVTMHWEAVAAFREAFPDIRVRDELYEIDRGRITCAGGTAAMDLMLDMIATRHGQALAVAVSEQFIHDRIRDRRDHQRMEPAARLGVSDSRLIKVITLMERHLDEPLGKDRLAGSCGVSTRQLERLFRARLGATPSAYYVELRLARARQLLRQTDMSVIEIAAACGFTSASSLSRAYRTLFAVPPSRDRLEPSRWMLPLPVARVR
ncbi:MAG: GlxA family transcriptional regulator [Methylobacteriaceae bacterium]|nr:GlxA family transcriptional regulator [Methylobacteriaceae bacterium]